MVGGRLVPWQSWHEWAGVREGLFSSRDNVRAAALLKVDVWRCRGRVPLSVDVTASLLETLCRDGGSDNFTAARHASYPEMQLRLLYAMSIIRLVNGISDSSQKGRVASSVLNLASEAGLPRLLVDIRHEATHSELPSLSVLRLAALRALEWVQEYYWRRQARSLQTNQQRVTDLLKEICRHWTGEVAQQALKRGGDESTGEADAAPAEAKPADLQKQRRALEADLKALVPKNAPDILAASILDHGAVPCPSQVDQAKAAGLSTLLGCLVDWFPGLPSALLVSAVTSVVEDSPSLQEPDRPAASQGLTEEQAATCLAWVELQVHQKAGGKKRKSRDAAALQPAWQCSNAQIQALLAASLKAPLKHRAAELRRERVDALSTILREALSIGQPAAAGGPQSSDSAAGSSATSDAAGTLEAVKQSAAAEMAAQLASLERAVKRKRAPASGEDVNKKWKVVESWKACALGNLPSAHDGAGSAPILDGMELACYDT